jgi:fibronectin type 3 domain-containing protein
VGHIYSYKVSALSGGSRESAQSAAASALMKVAGNVRVNAVTDSSASLAWDAVNGATGYNVYRCGSENGTYTRVNHSTISSAGYTDTGLDPLTEYYYKVSATIFELEGILSSPVSCTTLMPAPDNVRVTSVTDGSISFTWNAVNGASGYNIYRSSSVDGVYTKVNSSVVTQVFYADTGLSSNTNYHYRVSAVTNSIESVLSSVLSVATLLPAPENLRITAATDISVSLGWDALSGASGYNVYRSVSENGTYTKINSFVIIAVSYTNTGVSADTNYYYKICAVSSEGVEGIRSNAVSVATPISAPNNVRVTSVTDNSISLAWNAVNRASGYNIYRSSSVNGTYTKLNLPLISDVTYDDIGLSSNIGYYYKVSVVVDGIESLQSNAIFGATVLPAPGNLRVTAVTDASVSLEWNTVTGASGYNVYRSNTENGNYSKVNTIAIASTTFTDTGLAAFTAYYYKIRPVASGAEGLQSTPVSGTTLLAVPSNVRISAVTDSTISLAWDAVNAASGYNIYRSASENGTYSKVNTAAVTVFTDTGLNVSTTYYYKISAVKGDNESMRSNAVSCVTLMSAPGNVRISSVTDNSISLAWNAVSGASGYNVYRSTSENGTYTKVNTNTVIDTTFTDTGLTAFTVYYYKVSPVSGGADGILSSPVSGTTLMAAPLNVRISSVTGSTISLAWNTVNGASGYNVYRSTSENGTYSKVNSTTVTGTTFTNTGLAVLTTYYYRISAVTGNNESVRSNAVSGTTLSLRINAVTIDSISITWSAVNGTSSYNVYRSESENGPYTKINTGTITSTAFTDTNVSPYTIIYYYKISIVSGGVEGLLSDHVVSTIWVPGNGLVEKLDWLQSNTASNLLYSVGVDTDEYIPSHNLSYSGKNGISIILSGDATMRTINHSGTGSLLSAGTGVTLILGNNITLKGLPNNSRNLVGSNNGGTLIMNAGSKIIDNSHSSSYGGGVHIRGATFIMNGGEISGNSSSAGGGVFMEGGAFIMNGGKISGNTSSSNGGGVFANGTGTFTMNGGEISGNTSSSFGGGVYLHNDRTFTMNGGKILGNSARTGGGVYFNPGGTFIMTDGEICGNESSSSGATSGGVYISDGTFTMTGGKIYGNNSSSTGGVNVTGIFTMNGGEISGNTGGGYGGGVSAYGTFTMNGGKISGNTSSSNGGGVYASGIFTMNGGGISGNTSFIGGGVYAYATFTMNDGEISGNTTATSSPWGYGGGVYISSNRNFTMEGGKISGNTASGSYSYGGGVCVSNNGTFTMNDGEISGNTASNSYFYGGGVYVYNNGTFSKTGGTIYGYSVSDTSNSNVVKDSSGTVQSNRGHAVYIDTTKKREKTVHAGENLDSSIDGAAGGWVDP